MSSQKFVCPYCSKDFKAAKYLENHLKSGKECRKYRDVLFVCLRCNNFYTKKIGELDVHLESCPHDGRTTDIIEHLQDKIKKLEEKINPPKEPEIKTQMNVLNTTFGNVPVDDEYFETTYNQIIENKKYNHLLREIKQKRRTRFKNDNLVDYKTLLRNNLEKLKKVLKSKNLSDKKINKIIKTHFTSFDLRLLRYEGYINLEPDGSILRELDLVLTYKNKPECFSFEQINLILNYSCCVLPIKTLLKILLVQKEPIYAYMGKRKQDPYQFYYLEKVEKGLCFWNMDCRTIDFCNEFYEKVSSYLIRVFRKNYNEIYSDNIYRKNFLENMRGLTSECKQILQNLKQISHNKNLIKLTQCVIIKNNTLKIRQKDNLNLISDDPIITKIENHGLINFSRLFESPTQKDINNLINSIVIF